MNDFERFTVTAVRCFFNENVTGDRPIEIYGYRNQEYFNGINLCLNGLEPIIKLLPKANIKDLLNLNSKLLLIKQDRQWIRIQAEDVRSDNPRCIDAVYLDTGELKSVNLDDIKISEPHQAIYSIISSLPVRLEKYKLKGVTAVPNTGAEAGTLQRPIERILVWKFHIEINVLDSGYALLRRIDRNGKKLDIAEEILKQGFGRQMWEKSVPPAKKVEALVPLPMWHNPKEVKFNTGSKGRQPLNNNKSNIEANPVPANCEPPKKIPPKSDVVKPQTVKCYAVHSPPSVKSLPDCSENQKPVNSATEKLSPTKSFDKTVPVISTAEKSVPVKYQNYPSNQRPANWAPQRLPPFNPPPAKSWNDKNVTVISNAEKSVPVNYPNYPSNQNQRPANSAPEKLPPFNQSPPKSWNEKNSPFVSTPATKFAPDTRVPANSNAEKSVPVKSYPNYSVKLNNQGPLDSVPEKLPPPKRYWKEKNAPVVSTPATKFTAETRVAASSTAEKSVPVKSYLNYSVHQNQGPLDSQPQFNPTAAKSVISSPATPWNEKHRPVFSIAVKSWEDVPVIATPPKYCYDVSANSIPGSKFTCLPVISSPQKTTTENFVPAISTLEKTAIDECVRVTSTPEESTTETSVTAISTPEKATTVECVQVTSTPEESTTETSVPAVSISTPTEEKFTTENSVPVISISTPEKEKSATDECAQVTSTPEESTTENSVPAVSISTPEKEKSGTDECDGVPCTLEKSTIETCVPANSAPEKIVPVNCNPSNQNQRSASSFYLLNYWNTPMPLITVEDLSKNDSTGGHGITPLEPFSDKMVKETSFRQLPYLHELKSSDRSLKDVEGQQ